MKLGDKSLAAIRSFLENPTEQRCIYNLGTIYWSSFINSVTDLIHKEGDVNRFIEEEEDFLNAGVVDKVLENADEIKSTIKSETVPYNHLSIHTVTIWLSETIRKIYSGDKKDLLKHEIKNMEIQQEKIHNEIASVQQMRKKILLNEFSKKSDKKILFQIENLTNTDLLTFHNIQTQQEISKGAFFTVDNRREFVERTNRLEKEVAKNEIFFSKIKSLECKTALRKCNSQINELFKKSINCIDAIANKEKELDGIKNNLTPPGPVEENVYQFDDESLVKKNIGVLPTSLWQALNELKNSKLIQEVLGDYLFDRYVGIKTRELDEFKVQVTSWEIDKYLDVY